MKQDPKKPEAKPPILPQASIAHTCSSRVRLNFRRQKGDRKFFETLCDELITLEGIERAEARPLTGSVIITYEGELQHLLQSGMKAELFQIRDVSEEEQPEREAQTLLAWAETTLKDVVGNGVTIRSLAAMALLIMSLRQIAAGNIMPPAATALWYGLTLLLMREFPSEFEAGDGAE